VVVRGYHRKLWLGPITKTQAVAIGRHLEHLKRSAETATPPPADTARWSRAVSARIQKQLGKWGLIEVGPSSAELPRSLGGYSEFYLAARADTKPTTIARWRNVRNKLLEHWPAATSIAAITPGDCDRFAAAIRKRHKPSHAGKLIADSRQLFAAAVRDRLLEANPLAGIDSAAPHDRSRESYITPELAKTLIYDSPPQLACLLALARFGGLRVPSEPLALRLVDVDLVGGKLTIPTGKTGSRVVPIFPELRPHLERLAELAPTGATWLFNDGRRAAATLWRKQLGNVLARKSITPWPKRWQNLRASCRTDLESRFPEFVINAWLGHSSQIGAKHYTRVNESHFAAACGAAGGATRPISADTPRQRKPRATNKTP
jgi:integrase